MVTTHDDAAAARPPYGRHVGQREGRRRGGVGVLVLLMFVGIAIAVVSVGQVFQVGGSTWLGVLLGAAIAAAAVGLLMIKPPGGRR